MYATKLKKFDGWVLHTTNQDGNGEHDAATLPEDVEGGPEDGYSGEEDAAAPLDDHGYGGEEDAASPLEDDDGDQDDRGAVSEDSDDDIVPCGERALQLLAIRANFRVAAINGYDCQSGRCIYKQHEGEMEVQEQGMVDLIPIGPQALLSAYGVFTLEVFRYITRAGNKITDKYPVRVDLDFCVYAKEIEEYTESIFCSGPGHWLQITYLVIPNAIETEFEVKLKLKDLGSRSRAVYGKIKASTADYGNRSVHLFSRERGRSWSVPSGPTSILPLSPAVIAVPYRRQLELHIEVDLVVITILDNQEEYKNLEFSLTFTRGIRSQEREVDDDKVKVSIAFDPKI